MASLAGKTIQSTYKDLLQVSNSNSGVDGTLRIVEDGEGTSSALQISSSGVKSSGTLAVVGISTLSNNLIVNGNIDLSGDIDVDGTLEADAITVNGATLASVIQGTTVTNATNVTTNANLTGHITSVGNATALGSFSLAQLNTALSDATLSASFTETNDLSSNVTWANVPEANIPALATSKITSGTFDDARIASSNVTQHQASLSIGASQVGSGTFNDARIAASNVTQHAVSKATGGTFAQEISITHDHYTPNADYKVLHRGEFFQCFTHNIENLNVAANDYYVFPWQDDASYNYGAGGWSSSTAVDSSNRFLVPYLRMRLHKVIMKPQDNTFTSYPATITVKISYRYADYDYGVVVPAQTANPNNTDSGEFTMVTNSSAPAGVGKQPSLIKTFNVDSSGAGSIHQYQTYSETMEIMLSFKSDTTLSTVDGWQITTVWACML